MTPSTPPTMPALFIGHGSPMNAIEDNSYTQSLHRLGERLPRPKAILCISAHWQTKGTFITSTDKPKQIYDFYGFPEELYAVKYDAPGSSVAALKIHSAIDNFKIDFDNGQWGLDHGTWCVLRHLYPAADIPVLQLSLNVNLTPQQHFDLGRELQKLREHGIMIIGSGNIVHNLRTISWNENETPLPWASQFHEWFKNNLKNGTTASLINDFHASESGLKSVPTLEHYLPALYTLGARTPQDKLEIIVDQVQNASISMLSFLFTPSQN
ncbi:MAG: 4,5-DOPA-extradiol-dioxygenase [Pseudobdellovibrio sp.]